MGQLDLFTGAAELPDGFRYEPEFISKGEEALLLQGIEKLEFAPVKMHGVTAKRRVAHFGRGYEYNSATLTSAAPIPDFLLPLKERVAGFANCAPEDLAEVLVTDYPAGAQIGWHRDAPSFDIIVGVSLVGRCTMQFRRYPVQKSGGKIVKSPRKVLEPRSAYILHGSSRSDWQHHIPATETRRISVTFRTLRKHSVDRQPKSTEATEAAAN